MSSSTRWNWRAGLATRRRWPWWTFSSAFRTLESPKAISAASTTTAA
ncbi:hypothetical protein [Streptomyces sp. NPDC059224]